MKNLPTFSVFLNEEKSISDLSDRDEKPMIKGIAEIINRVKDPENKKQTEGTTKSIRRTRNRTPENDEDCKG